MTTYTSIVLRFRWLVVIIFFLVTILFAYFFSNATIQSTPSELFFGDSPQYHRYLDRSQWDYFLTGRLQYVDRFRECGPVRH